MATVKLQEVVKVFGDVVAVQKLNFTIKEGEFFTFLGPSGCGKTTTLRMIAGFYYPTEGKVLFDEKDMTKVPPEQRNTGMVFQNYALFPHMTVFENVAFGLKLRKLSKSEIKIKVLDALAKVRLKGYEDRQITQLSGGQQQRVALARALAIEPAILLLDEPLSNLDARLRDEMRMEIKRLQKEYGITTIYVTHDQVEALSMSDRIAVFNMGVCQQVGTPYEIYNQPANDFVASFIGETNLFPVILSSITEKSIIVQLEDRIITVKNEPLNSAEGIDKGPVSLSIRPERIKMSTNPIGVPNELEGKVELIQFIGNAMEYEIRWKNYLIKALVLNDGNEIGLKEGDPVWVTLNEDQLRVIPRITEVKKDEK
ncbi:ABC transporter ATP-binding protein [Tepidibacillus decaturensis]|uniref:Spermidine/putrescine import ATP-binding protein PotA n=1 Tax=Tepidibacillus decaturensis TaxID=1413211 RepID=A0A135L6Q4_9BACI|nr:ABC transporter ATP-binding protein [Tepidibacillus decaturensis]KXG44577.1 spermidine/putrescine ABC transporter ATP-binding protein [Tepidibacillus decaturensis]